MVRTKYQRAARKRRGLTLLEMSFAIAILSLVGIATSATLAVSTGSNTVNMESVLAYEAAQSVIEEMRVELDTNGREAVVAAYNGTAADDPLDAVGAPMAVPGASFAVNGLDPIAGDADGMVGSVQFPGDGTQLLEDVNDRDLGMPRDLNGDGVVDGLDHATDHLILPVRVQVTFQGRRGPRTITLVTAL